MRRNPVRFALAVVFALALVLTVAVGVGRVANAAPPAERVAMLRKGVNITGWFRYPGSRDPAALRAYIGEPALLQLRRVGFTFARLAVDPVLVMDPPFAAAVLEAIQRLNGAGLGVVVSLHPTVWRLESSQADRDALLATWRSLAPRMSAIDPALLLPEVLNEPVFSGAPMDWQVLQQQALAIIRTAMPAHTVVLTGHDWSSISGLVAATPETDSNIVYTFHFYDPPELTSLAAYRADVDRIALARLPFPVHERELCDRIAGQTWDARTAGLMRFYCASGWTERQIVGRIARAAERARRNRIVLLAGEFGATADLNLAARANWLAVARAAMEAQGIGWALWGYDDVMGLAIKRPPGASPRLNPVVLSALGLSEQSASR